MDIHSWLHMPNERKSKQLAKGLNPRSKATLHIKCGDSSLDYDCSNSSTSAASSCNSTDSEKKKKKRKENESVRRTQKPNVLKNEKTKVTRVMMVMTNKMTRVTLRTWLLKAMVTKPRYTMMRTKIPEKEP